MAESLSQSAVEKDGSSEPNARCASSGATEQASSGGTSQSAPLVGATPVDVDPQRGPEEGALPVAMADREASPRCWLDALLDTVDRRRWWILPACLIFYLAGYTTHWRIKPDSGIFLVIARNIVEGAGFIHPLGTHRHLTPGLPYMLSWVMRVAGTDAMWAINAVMMAIGVINVGLVYWLARLHAGRAPAVLVAVMVAMAESHYMAALTPLTDLPFLTGLLVALIGLERMECERRGLVLSIVMVV
ncbi:MAG: ArnT family glycosyltransferase, partial [Planctomycetota bacterium]